MISVLLDNVLPRANAQKLITSYCLSSPEELNIEQLAFAEGLYIKYEKLNNCQGKIVFNQNTGLITINSNLTDSSQIKFTIAHEMGHFYNERDKTDQIRRDKQIGHFSQIQAENDANTFAAELLMYEPWFSDFQQNKKFSKYLLSEITNYFNVSLTAAAFRYAEIGCVPVALVYSVNGIIKWSAINKDFPYQFIERNVKVSKNSYAFDYFNGESIPNEEDVPATAWFKSYEHISDYERVMETNIPMPSFNGLLTVLWEKTIER